MRYLDARVLDQLQNEEIRIFSLLYLEVSGSYFTDCDIPLYVDGNLYTPHPYRIQPITYGADQLVLTMDVEVANLDQALTTYFVGGTPQKTDVTLKLIALDSDLKPVAQVTGPVAYWPCDDGFGDTLRDESGNGHIGTAYNLDQSDWNYNRVQFNGTDEYIEVPDASDLDSIKCFVAQIKPISEQSSATLYHIACSKHIGGKFGLYLRYDTSPNKIVIRFEDSSGNISSVGYSIPDYDAWYNVVGYFDTSDNKAKLYVDGSYIGAGSAINDANGSGTDMTSASVHIGGGISSRYSYCRMKQILLYDRTPSSEEITKLSDGEFVGPGAVIVHQGEIDSWSLTEEAVRITVSDELVRWSQRTLSTYSPSCRWKKFKGTECKYSGSETWCDRSYDRCSALGNTDNYGGFRWLPSLEKKIIWWGQESKVD